MTGRPMRQLLLSMMTLLVAWGCVQKQKRPAKVSREMAGQIVSTQPPKPDHALDVRFENKVRLIGYDLSPPQAREGQNFTVTWYWQVDAPLGEGWKVFTHLADASKRNRVNLDAQRPLRELYPEDSWRKGDYIKDVQEVSLPVDWHSPAAVFYVGFWNGPKRLRVVVGPNDGDNRAEVLSVPVGEQSKPPELPRLIARRATGPIAIDGKLDEKDWREAQPSGAFVQTMSGERGAFTAGTRVAYDDKNLYVAFQVEDDYLKSTFKKNDEHLWEQDTVEVMVDPDGDAKNYFELQVAPTGVVFDTRYDSRRQPQPFGDMAWSSALKAKVALQGKPNDDEADVGYAVEMAIPWTAFAAGPTPAQPPAAGSTWRMNFFVMDARREGQRAVGWSAPLIGDFHTLDRFGRVVFPEAAASAK